MNSQELLEYVRRAKDLEADIYQNELLEKKLEEKRQKGTGYVRSSHRTDRPLHDRGRTHCRVW